MPTNDNLLAAVRATIAVSQDDEPGFDSAMVTLRKAGIKNAVEAFCQLGISQAELLSKVSGDSTQSIISGLGALILETYQEQPASHPGTAARDPSGSDRRPGSASAPAHARHPGAKDRPTLYLVPEQGQRDASET